MQFGNHLPLGLDVNLPRNFDTVYVFSIFFDPGQETDPYFRSGVNRDADAQQVKYQGCQTFDEKHLKKLKICFQWQIKKFFLWSIARFIFLLRTVPFM